MEEKRENKVVFDDKNYEIEYQEMVKRNREKNGMTTELLKTIVNRIINGIANYEVELIGIPDKYREQFQKLYEDSTKK